MRKINHVRQAAITFLLVVGLLVLGLCAGVLKAQEAGQCPPPTKQCKIITLTPEEEQTLIGPDMLFDQAQWARQQFGPLIKAWRDKLQNAPAGKAAPEKPAKP